MIYKKGRTLKSYMSDKKVWVLLFAATFGLFLFRMPPRVPLYYSQVLKEDRLAHYYELLIIPFFVYCAFVVAEKWLYKLTLENTVVKEVISLFLWGLAFFAYIIFLKILLVVT